MGTTNAQLDSVYVAGPMSHMPEWNYPAFHAMAARLRAKGLKVVNPAEHYPDPDNAPPWERCLRTALEGLLRCNTIVLLDGWQTSRGAKLEHHVADQLGMELIPEYLVDEWWRDE